MPKDVKAPIRKSYTSTMIASVIAAILLVICSLALWVNNSLFDTENFSQTATASLTSESSRKAVAQAVTDEALKDKPAVKNIVEEPAVKVISSILDTERFKNILQRLSGRIQIVLTTKRPEPIVINLEAIKGFLGKLVEVIGQERDVQVDPSKIPSEIVLLDKERLPNFYNLGVTVLWLGPIALLGALVLLIYPYIRQRRIAVKPIVIVQGLSLAAIGLLALLLEPLLRPFVLGDVANQDIRIVIDNLYSAFMQPLNAQFVRLITIGAMAAFVAGCLMIAKRTWPKNRFLAAL